MQVFGARETTNAKCSYKALVATRENTQREMHDEASSRVDEQQPDGFSSRSEIPPIYKQLISTSITNNIPLQPEKMFCKVFIVPI